MKMARGRVYGILSLKNFQVLALSAEYATMPLYHLVIIFTNPVCLVIIFSDPILTRSRGIWFLQRPKTLVGSCTPD